MAVLISQKLLMDFHEVGKKSLPSGSQFVISIDSGIRGNVQGPLEEIKMPRLVRQLD